MIDQLTSFNYAGQSNFAGRQNDTRFPHPYLDYTSTAVPRSFAELLDWSEYMYLSSPEIREMNKRLFNYFNTDIKVTPIDSDRKMLDDQDVADWRQLLESELNWNVQAMEMLDNLSIYGQDFLSVLAPHVRMLTCPACTRSVEMVQLANAPGTEFRYERGTFAARCQSPVCKRQGSPRRKMIVHDVKTIDPKEMILKHWPVREMIIHHRDWTGRCEYLWNIPEDYKRQVRFGDLETLAEADPVVLDAIEKGELFKFKSDRIFHVKEPTLSGLKTRGWGLPRTIYLARPCWTLQLVRKQIQALGIDYITPMRVVSPAGQGQVSTPYQMTPNVDVNHEDFDRVVAQMRQAHRQDPTRIHSVSMPIDYRIFGGEASQLFPDSLHQQAKEDVLDAGGFPIDIYKANLTVQAAPVGLRLFEAQNRTIPSILNQALTFVVGRLGDMTSLDPINAKHQRVTLVDNLETAMMRLQMASGGQASMTSAMDTIGMNYEDELQTQMHEQKTQMRLQQDMQEEMANQQGSMQMMNQMTQGDPNAQGGGQGDPAMQDPTAGLLPSNGLQIPLDPMGMEGAVTALAQTLSMADPGTRSRELEILRTQNPTAHGLLRTRLEQADRAMASQGRQMMLQGGM